MKTKGKTFDFIITRADYMNSSKEFVDNQNCPMAIAFRRQFPKVKMTGVFTHGVYIKSKANPVLIGSVKESFLATDYVALKNYGKHFKTTITFN